jgi:hypothetical protein
MRRGRKLTAVRPDAYHVVERKGWSYVEGDPKPEWSGPWRYRWEAQEEADRLNLGSRHKGLRP